MSNYKNFSRKHRSLCDSETLLEIMWKAWHIKEEIDKLDSIKIITFYSLKQTAKIKSFRLEDKICKLNNKGTTQFLKMAKYRLQISPWKDAQYH